MRDGLYSFLKLAAPVAPSHRIQEKLDEHFGISGDGKKWAQFRKNLRSKQFLGAVLNDERADDKLKQYSQMVHLHKAGKGPVVPIKGDSGKTYNIKYHPEIDRFSCSCPDWTIKHTVDGGDCKHIGNLKSQLSMVKKAGAAITELFGLGRAGEQLYRTENNDQQAWRAKRISQLTARRRYGGGR